MDMIRLNIPYAFVRSHSCVSWRGMRFGLQNELLDPEAPREFAFNQIAEIESPSQALLDLATAGKNDAVSDLVDQLAASEPEYPEAHFRDKWLYLVLLWIYEHQADYPDPLQQVEEVYADFDYPEQIATFVRYMPMDGPDLGSREANENRLFNKWRQYLEEAGQ